MSNSRSESQRSIISLAGAVDLGSIERLDREFARATWIGTGRVALEMSQPRPAGDL
jgi:hypothetical protein